ncbi:MAG: hypothetical protein LUE15_07205 [Oscillospiraceae bacterium]|nr:hypothetical protein [Oscillospiraceae bacterium]
MPDRVVPGPVESCPAVGGSVNIHTRKIYDSCRDKDCVEDLRVYPTVSSQALIDSAFSVRPNSAELLYADVNVDAVSFNRGYYTVDVTYFYKVTGNVFPGGSAVTGLAVFDKRVILFGSEGAVKVFSSRSLASVTSAENPAAYVEAVNPIALNMRFAESDCCTPAEPEQRSIPGFIIEAIGEDLVLNTPGRRLYVTLGQFSIIRLERDSQLTLTAADFFPTKECVGSSDDDPCTLFSRVRFPVDEFFPPDCLAAEEDYKALV